MRSESISHIPLLDDYGRIVRIQSLHDLISPSSLPNPVIIMAGGKGKRLRPHTENCPKPMLLVDGKPMLEILINNFKSLSLTVSICQLIILRVKLLITSRMVVGLMSKSITLLRMNHLAPLVLFSLLPRTLDTPFLVTNGDVLTKLNPLNLLHFHNEHKSSATLCVREHITTIPYGVVQVKDIDLIGFEEKPSYRQLVNAGVYVIDPSLFTLIPPNQAIDMPSVLQLAQNSGHRVVVCPIHEYWIDVGRPAETLQQSQECPPMLNHYASCLNSCTRWI